MSIEPATGTPEPPQGILFPCGAASFAPVEPAPAEPASIELSCPELTVDDLTCSVYVLEGETWSILEGTACSAGTSIFSIESLGTFSIGIETVVPACEEGAVCNTGNPCTVGAIACGPDGVPSCVVTSNEPAGTTCNANDFCDGNGNCIVDNDGDGLTDCAPDNPDIFPGANELCGDNLDNDCDGLIDSNDPDCSFSSDCANEIIGPVDPKVPAGCIPLDQSCSIPLDLSRTECAALYDQDRNGSCTGGVDTNGDGYCVSLGEPS